MLDEYPEARSLAASGLKVPLADLSKLELDERAVRRIWDGIERQLQAPSAGASRGWLPPRWIVATVGALALALGAARWLTQPSTAERVVLGDAGPLLTADGRDFESLDGPLAEGSQRVGFADGSSIEAWPGTRVERLASTSREFALFLRQGRVRVSVAPHGPRRWSLETRGARVEVVGTIFSVLAERDRVEVQVEKGVVLVRSELLPDGVQRLAPGDRVAVETGQTALDRAAGDAPSARQAASDARPDGRAEEPASTKRTGAKLAAPGLGKWPSAAQLWEQADSARRAGDAARAALVLEQLLAGHPRDAQAPLAAFTLGRIQLEQLARPQAAARSFRRAIDLGITSGLLESCYLRLGDALQRSGDRAALRALLAEYEQRFPNGRHRAPLERWSAEKPLEESELPAGSR